MRPTRNRGTTPQQKGVLEFLIKAAGETAEKLVALPPGAAVEASPVQGKVRPRPRRLGGGGELAERGLARALWRTPRGVFRC